MQDAQDKYDDAGYIRLSIRSVQVKTDIPVSFICLCQPIEPSCQGEISSRGR
jgi:hypothetical protein